MKRAYTVLDPAAARAQLTPRGGCALGVMIKAPRAGASKTRLVPPLTHEEAAALSVCFLRDTAGNVAAACESAGTVDGRDAASGVAVYTPVGAESAFAGLLPEGFSLLAQRGDGFGERLFNAADDLLRLGFDSLCLIDSDSPTLPTRALAAAVEELSRPGDRVVLGTADDGGYYLIGLKHAHRRLFEQIDWSTERVLKQTVERACEINLDVALLPAWYDVDDAATLARLCEELFGDQSEIACAPGGATLKGYEAAHTRAHLAGIIGREGLARVWPAGSGAERARDGEGGAGDAAQAAEASR
ncbi:MAG TPA: TIGR04282 family arsenosugar biosynthesis glycosyltransferase [Pyrinomonadaceae bacterium]|nr:TIGR04282 family arsenosugar biosynthesis glycosyltransferase [Pyrinomonadaceae bacterium]